MTRIQRMRSWLASAAADALQLPFAAIRVFSGQKKSGAVAPHSKISACPAVSSRRSLARRWKFRAKADVIRGIRGGSLLGRRDV